jgi:GNAT superfamily N-acetyltransferase
MIDPDKIKLDNIFILPDFIGKGFGRILMEDAIKRIKGMKYNKIILDSEPNAEK